MAPFFITGLEPTYSGSGDWMPRLLHFLVGGFNPFVKYARQNGSLPSKRDEHKKNL